MQLTGFKIQKKEEKKKKNNLFEKSMTAELYGTGICICFEIYLVDLDRVILEI